MKLPQSSNSCMSSSVENTALHLVDNKLLKGSPSISPKKQLSSESDPDNKAISSSNSNSNNSAGSELAASMQTKSLHKSSTSLEKVNKPNSSPRSNCHPKNGRCVAGHKNIKANFDQFAKCLSRDLLTHAFLDVQDSGDTVIFSRRSSEPIQISNGPALQRLENSNPTINGKRTQKSKTDEDIEKFAEELNHQGETCEVEEDYRRVSSSFRDPVLSRFAIELMKTNVSVPTLKLPNGAISTSSSTRSQDRISSMEYEDALDVPYGRLEEFADMMAGRVLVHSVAMYRQEKESVLRRQYGRPISTGNWGCGAFGGDPHLKSLLQWMAASYAGTPYMAYYSFNNAKMTRDVVETIQSRGWNVSSLMQAIRRYCIMAGEQIEQRGQLSQCHDLFDVIIQSNFPGL